MNWTKAKTKGKQLLSIIVEHKRLERDTAARWLKGALRGRPTELAYLGKKGRESGSKGLKMPETGELAEEDHEDEIPF